MTAVCTVFQPLLKGGVDMFRIRNGNSIRVRKIAALIAAVLLFVSGCGGTGRLQQDTAAAAQQAGQKQQTAEETDAAAGQQDNTRQNYASKSSAEYWFSGKTADEILAKLTLEQKIWQMIQPAVYSIDPKTMKKCDFGSVLSKYDGYCPSDKEWRDVITKLQNAALSSETGLPFIYGQDDVHGVNYCRGSVIFPHNIGLGAANDADLMYEIGAATADEVKLTGMLWNFAPCVAVSTDPRWGRTYESYSSDPEIVGNLGTAYVRGLGDNGVAACGKHFFADGAEEWGTGENGYLIDRGDANLSDEEIDELLGVYKKLIDAGVPTIMLSHGSVGGVKMHENAKYISVLRDELGFDGMIVSDWESIHNISGKDFSEQMANAINAGVDMLMEPAQYNETFNAVMEGVKNGSISEERIDDAVRHILQFKIDSGVMDDPLQKNVKTRQVSCGSDAYHSIAEKAVEESLVLLKNEGSVLPLREGISVYVTGPAADNTEVQCGGWTESWKGATRPVEGAVSMLDGLRQCAEKQNITIITDSSKASKADVTLLFIGEQPYAEWNGDSADISIDGQLALPENSKAIAEARNLRSKYGIPTVACILAGRQVIISDYLDDWDAAVMCYLPGSAGEGVANVLTGRAAFTGKLPMPWYEDVSQIGTDRCLFPVGYGLETGNAATEKPREGSKAQDDSGSQPAAQAGDSQVSGEGQDSEKDGAEKGGDSDGIVSKFGNHTYTLVEKGLSWSEAEEYCVQHGGHLASAGSAEEQNFLIKFAEKTSRGNIWIGGYLSEDGSWRWTDGSKFSFEWWDDNQPDNYEGKETCIRFTSRTIYYDEWTANKGRWNDTADEGDEEARLSDFAFIMEQAA